MRAVVTGSRCSGKLRPVEQPESAIEADTPKFAASSDLLEAPRAVSGEGSCVPRVRKEHHSVGTVTYPLDPFCDERVPDTSSPEIGRDRDSHQILTRRCRALRIRPKFRRCPADLQVINLSNHDQPLRVVDGGRHHCGESVGSCPAGTMLHILNAADVVWSGNANRRDSAALVRPGVVAFDHSTILHVETNPADRPIKSLRLRDTNLFRKRFGLRAPELDGHSVKLLAGAPRRRTSTIGAEKAGVRPISIRVAFAEISDLDKMNGTDPLPVRFPATPCCPENAVISADNSPVNRTD